MLLVTTADTATWGRDEELLFLGEWCLVAGRREALDGRRFQVLPYHWNDRAKLHRDGRMLWERYQALLPGFAAVLNEIHATEHNVDYWRRAFGYGLLGLLTLLWDRLECLNHAAQDGAQTSHYQPYPVAVQSYTDLMAKASASDVWNAAFCVMLGNFVPPLRAIPLTGNGLTPRAPTVASGHVWRKQLVSRLAATLPQRFAFVNMGVPVRTLARLALSQGQIPAPINAPPVPYCEQNDILRARFRLDCGDDAFGKICSAVIPQIFPTAALEGYGKTLDVARKRLPRAPRAIITAQAQYNEVFTLWAAELSRKGVPLGIMQHGGHYGTDLTELAEEEEIRTCDTYFTWGWHCAASNTVPTPALKLIPWKEKTFGTPDGDLLIVYDAGHRYPYRIFSTPIAAQRQTDNGHQIAFLEALAPDLRERLRLRLHPVDDGYGFRESLIALGLLDRIDTPKPMSQSVDAARICIVANNSTSMLEVLTSGIPTFIFYDPQFAEVRDAAKPFFDALADAEILHTDPLVLAEKVRDVWADPSRWWSSEAVQAARQAFVAEFCAGGGDWAAQWRTALAKLAVPRSSRG